MKSFIRRCLCWLDLNATGISIVRADIHWKLYRYCFPPEFTREEIGEQKALVDEVLAELEEEGR
jgi:hypothetical protein